MTWEDRVRVWLNADVRRIAETFDNYAFGLPTTHYLFDTIDNCTYRNGFWINAQTLSQMEFA